jgi:NAD+ kinase
MRRALTVGLTSKTGDERAAAMAAEIGAWLEANGAGLIACDPGPGRLACAADLLVCIGGDGTIIRVARRMLGSPVPLVGVNLGRVGFLAELSPENWQEGLGRALTGGFTREKRLALEYVLEREGEDQAVGHAVNDVVISRGGLARLLDLDLYIDGRPLQYLRADGLIIATPTGSTAYSSSAGGPMLQPDMRVYSIAAICPFINKMLPMVLGENNIFRAGVRPTGARPFVTVDGQELFELRPGDTLSVRALPEAVIFARFGISDYLGKLRSTGFVIDSPGGTGL